MEIEEVIKSWRELSVLERYEAVRMLSQLLESSELEKELTETSEKVSKGIHSEPGNQAKATNHFFHCGDFNSPETVELLKKHDLQPRVIVTSPPFNSGAIYSDDFNDKKSTREYINFLNKFMDNCDAVLKNGGRLVINLKDISTGKGKRLPIIVPLYGYLCGEKGYTYRGMHIWYKGREESSFAWGSWKSSRSPAIIDLYEYVFVFQKGNYPDGKDDLYKTEFIENVIGVWKIRPVRKIFMKDKKKINVANHPCPFPIELPKRIIKLYSHVGDLVLDPFAGIFSTNCAAAEAGRDSIAVELNRDYCKVGAKKFRQRYSDSMFQKIVLKELKVN